MARTIKTHNKGLSKQLRAVLQKNAISVLLPKKHCASNIANKMSLVYPATLDRVDMHMHPGTIMSQLIMLSALST